MKFSGSMYSIMLYAMNTQIFDRACYEKFKKRPFFTINFELSIIS